MDSEKLMRQAESQMMWRRLALTVNGLSYFAWIGSRGLNDTGAFGLQPGQWSLIQMLSWPIWLISLCLVVTQIVRLRRNLALARLLDDERTAHIKQRAFQAGYWTLLLAVAAVYTATYLVPVDINVVLPLLLATGVTVPSFVYAWLYRG